MWVLSRSLFPSMTRRRQASIAVQLTLLLHCVAAFAPTSLPTATAQASRPASTSHSNCNNNSGRQKPAANQSFFRSSWQAPAVDTDTAMAAAAGASSGSPDLELKSENTCFGGRLLRYVHQSTATKTPMTFSVFLPRLASKTPVPVRGRQSTCIPLGDRSLTS